MIVKCASCQTRFKIGDDKVTVRGVKVRCTKCGTVFRVAKEPPAEAPLSRAATPLEDLVAPASPQGPKPAADAAPDALEDIFQSMVPQATVPDGPSHDPSHDDFSGSAPGSPAPDMGPELAGGEFGLDVGAVGAAHDPFSLLNAGISEPTPPPTVHPAKEGKSPLETLASLDDPFDLPLDPLGKNRTPMPPPPRTAMEEDPFAAFAAGAAANGGIASSPSVVPSDALPMEHGAPELDAFADPLAGLNLDPARAVGSAPAPPVPEDAGAHDTASVWDSPLELDDGAPPPPRQDSPRPPTNSGVYARGPTGETTKVVGVMQGAAAAVPLDGGAAERERSRRVKEEVPLATRVLNAAAGISIVVLALLVFVIWRNGGRVDLRDPGSAFLSAFGVHVAVPASQSLPASISGSGLYRSESGLPLLFVRGRVQNLTQQPQRVRVRLTVEDSGRVATEVEAWPTVLPSPDELYGVRSSADLKALQQGWDDHEPPALRPQSEADFLLVTAELPTNLGSLLLKVAAVPQGVGSQAEAPSPPLSPTPAPAARPGLVAGAQPAPAAARSPPPSSGAAAHPPMKNGPHTGPLPDPAAP